MKQIVIVLLVLFSTAFANAQVSKKDSLTGTRWQLASEKMSGVGVHNSLPKGTTLQFHADGVWESSELIMGTKNGAWSIENNRTLVMKYGNEEVKYLIQSLSGSVLNYRLKKNAATFTYQWVKME
jgi:hypothetical protein